MLPSFPDSRRGHPQILSPSPPNAMHPPDFSLSPRYPGSGSISPGTPGTSSSRGIFLGSIRSPSDGAGLGASAWKRTMRKDEPEGSQTAGLQDSIHHCFSSGEPSSYTPLSPSSPQFCYSSLASLPGFQLHPSQVVSLCHLLSHLELE